LDSWLEELTEAADLGGHDWEPSGHGLDYRYGQTLVRGCVHIDTVPREECAEVLAVIEKPDLVVDSQGPGRQLE
jgi:hypothetical protein